MKRDSKPQAWHLGFFGPRPLSPLDVNQISVPTETASQLFSEGSTSILTQSPSWTRGLKPSQLPMPTVASIAQLPASVNAALIHTARPIPMPLALPAPDTPGIPC